MNAPVTLAVREAVFILTHLVPTLRSTLRATFAPARDAAGPAVPVTFTDLPTLTMVGETFSAIVVVTTTGGTP